MKFSYTKIPSRNPNRTWTSRPFVPIKLLGPSGNIIVDALVDSGADSCVFDASIGHAIFGSHGTTFDNEAHKALGHFDVALSPLGEKQAKEMGERYKNDHFDAIFCSDLQRSYKTAEIAFGDKFQIIKDVRLRECDYGDMTQVIYAPWKWQPGWKYKLRVGA